MDKRWVRIVGWLVVWGTALFFAQTGLMKLGGWGHMPEMFKELGYPDWVRLAVGLAELAGAILLVVRRSILLGAVGLSALMLGAVASELAAGHGMQALLPGQWLLIVAAIAAVRLRLQRRQTHAGQSEASPGQR